MNSMKEDSLTVGANRRVDTKKYHTNYTKNRRYLHQLDRTRLVPKDYYRNLFPQIKLQNKNSWISVLCCFHDDHNPSLRINLNTGGFRCFACNAHGGGIIDFHRQRYNLTFKAACLELGVW